MLSNISREDIERTLKNCTELEKAAVITNLTRHAYRESLYWTCKELLLYKDINPTTHGKMIKALEAPTNRKLIVMPRGTFKSSIGVVGYSIWRLIRNPNERILIESEVYTNSKNFLREIKNHLESPRITELFGTFATDTKWAEGEITVATRTKNHKEPSIVCGSPNAIKVGQHYTCIINDDMNSNNNSNSNELREKVIDHYRMNQAILEPDGTYLIIGTRYAENDLIGHILGGIQGWQTESFGIVNGWDEAKEHLKAWVTFLSKSSDEVLFALDALKKVPGYYRDHYPEDLEQLRDTILSKLATPTFYQTNIWDAAIDLERSKQNLELTLRGHLISSEVKQLNDQNKTPHIVDLGPGEYWLPIALHTAGYKFTYKDIGLSSDARLKSMPIISTHCKEKPSEDQPVIFVACEIIEHLHNESDIKADMIRHRVNPDTIHISTPKYTFDPSRGSKKWEEIGDLGHLRTYTPKEFIDVVVQMFPKFEWSFYNEQIMHLKGVKKNVDKQ